MYKNRNQESAEVIKAWQGKHGNPTQGYAGMAFLPAYTAEGVSL